MAKWMEIKRVIDESRTIYIYGVNSDGKPFIIINSKVKFNINKPVEAFAKIKVIFPIAIILVKIRQRKKQLNLQILIPPDEKLRNFVNVIADEGSLLLSLMKIDDFKDLYLNIMEGREFINRDYDAVTFEIPLANAEALSPLVASIEFLDRRKLKELIEMIEEKQDRELIKIGDFHG